VSYKYLLGVAPQTTPKC